MELPVFLKKGRLSGEQAKDEGRKEKTIPRSYHEPQVFSKGVDDRWGGNHYRRRDHNPRNHGCRFSEEKTPGTAFGKMGGNLLPELSGKLCHESPGGKRKGGMDHRESPLAHLRREDLSPGADWPTGSLRPRSHQDSIKKVQSRNGQRNRSSVEADPLGGGIERGGCPVKSTPGPGPAPQAVAPARVEYRQRPGSDHTICQGLWNPQPGIRR